MINEYTIVDQQGLREEPQLERSHVWTSVSLYRNMSTKRGLISFQTSLCLPLLILGKVSL